MEHIKLSRKIPEISGIYIVKVAFDKDGIYEDDGKDHIYLATINVEGESVSISPLSSNDYNDEFVLDKNDETVSFFGPIEFAKEAKKVEKVNTETRKLYLVMPLEHGNGGWHGSETLAHASVEWMLKRNPVETYLEGDYDPEYGSYLRLCKTEDPNSAVYLFDHEKNVWLNSRGYPIEATK